MNKVYRTLKNEQCRSLKFLSNFGLRMIIALKDNNFVSEEMRELDFLGIKYITLNE